MATVLADNYQLKWHSHSAHLHGCVSTLYRSNSFTDVTLVTTDGRYIPAHRFVLSACSSYLNRVLQIGCQAPTGNTVVVLPPEVSYSTLAILMQYMYSGEATVSNDQLQGVLRAGELLRVRGLCHSGKPPTSHQSSRHHSKQSSSMAKLTDPGEPSHRKRDANRTPDLRIEDNMKIELLVKEEPIDWDDQQDDIHSITHSEHHSSASIKSQERTDDDNSMYAPLTCDLCQETFKTPALWVRHIETHPPTDVPRKRRKKSDEEEEDDDENEYPSLRCELCQEIFTSPGEWVRHIQTLHTDEQLAVSNSTSNVGVCRVKKVLSKETCPQCLKTFPSHASMLIHIRTHTGERPYVCSLCEKGFNVKSNLLRHLRTLHDHIVAPGDTD